MVVGIHLNKVAFIPVFGACLGLCVLYVIASTVTVEKGMYTNLCTGVVLTFPTQVDDTEVLKKGNQNGDA